MASRVFALSSAFAVENSRSTTSGACRSSVGRLLLASLKRLWFGVFVSSEDRSFSWTDYARDVYELGYDPTNAKLIDETGQRLKKIYETKLEPLRLESTFETFRTRFVEQTCDQQVDADGRTPESVRFIFEMSFESLRCVCVCVPFRFANEEGIQRV